MEGIKTKTALRRLILSVGLKNSAHHPGTAAGWGNRIVVDMVPIEVAIVKVAGREAKVTI
jgi:hypothetical protein